MFQRVAGPTWEHALLLDVLDAVGKQPGGDHHEQAADDCEESPGG